MRPRGEEGSRQKGFVMTVSFEAEERTLAALARGASPAVACAEGPMSQASLQRRVRRDEFVRRLDLKKEVVSVEIDDQLRALMRLGVDVLAKVLKLETNPKLQLAAVRMLMPDLVADSRLRDRSPRRESRANRRRATSSAGHGGDVDRTAADRAARWRSRRSHRGVGSHEPEATSRTRGAYRRA